MATRGDDGNTLRLPKAVALTLALILLSAGGAWVRQEETAKRLLADNDTLKVQVAYLAREVAEVRRGVQFTRADAESMRSDMMAEIRRTRAVMNARMDDLEYRVSMIANNRRRMP